MHRTSLLLLTTVLAVGCGDVATTVQTEDDRPRDEIVTLHISGFTKSQSGAT